ncbi:MAG: M15 family metallopeptidase [Pyrinomonadaceae bacterium]
MPQNDIFTLLQPQNDVYYVYTAKFFDTPFSIANKFGITEQQLRDANPQWKNRMVIFLNFGEEVIIPDSVNNSLMFNFMNSGLITKYRKGEQKKAQPNYPPDWHPPKPGFGSPSHPLSALLAKLGNPKYTVDKPGTYHSPITFTDGWDKRNISTVDIPQLKGVPFFSLNGTKGSGRISFYTKAHAAVQALFKAWEDDGLISKILTFEGSFNARVIKKTLTPSNHSFGTAFDINGSWNPEGHKAAGIGKSGCLLELVPRASELGFYWGGFYSDAMHFEYAKL